MVCLGFVVVEDKHFLSVCECLVGEDVMCPSLMNPENGRVDFTTSVGDTATYTCDDEYILSGNSTRLCLPSGMWSGNAPTCNCKLSQCTDCTYCEKMYFF